MRKKDIILGITGSIAAYKACELVTRLSKKGRNTICVMTKEAEEFIKPLTLETLSGNKVYKDMFALPDKRPSNRPERSRGAAHVSLGQRADLIVICPATANIIGKLASGICDDLLSATVISSTAPVLIAPAMNDRMYRNKITQRNMRQLKEAGYKFVDPVKGHLTCGYVGVGHLADIGRIIKRIEKALK
jgi:phosphopantothenoylcysteine synthetase/decarboxylase